MDWAMQPLCAKSRRMTAFGGNRKPGHARVAAAMGEERTRSGRGWTGEQGAFLTPAVAPLRTLNASARASGLDNQNIAPHPLRPIRNPRAERSCHTCDAASAGQLFRQPRRKVSRSRRLTPSPTRPKMSLGPWRVMHLRRLLLPR